MPFAVIAVVGLASISFGVPLYLLYVMHKAMNAKMQEVQRGQKKRGTLCKINLVSSRRCKGFSYYLGGNRCHKRSLGRAVATTRLWLQQ